MDALAERTLGRRASERTPAPEEYVGRQERLFHQAVERLGLEQYQLLCIRDALNILHRLYKEEGLREDGGKPMLHVLRVATRVAETSRKMQKNTAYHHILAALFHDGVEDHSEALARMGSRTGKDDHIEALQYIGDTFGEEPAHIVAHTSKRPNAPHLTPIQKIAAYVAYVRGLIQDPNALKVKLADIRDNVTHPSPNRKQRAYAMKKYTEALKVISEGLAKHKTFIIESWGYTTYLQMRTDILAAKLRATLG